METNGRKINVEVSGIPMENNENCSIIIQKLADLMKVEHFNKNSVDVVRDVWLHVSCSGLTYKKFKSICKEPNYIWYCQFCIEEIFPFW